MYAEYTDGLYTLTLTPTEMSDICASVQHAWMEYAMRSIQPPENIDTLIDRLVDSYFLASDDDLVEWQMQAEEDHHHTEAELEKIRLKITADVLDARRTWSRERGFDA